MLLRVVLLGLATSFTMAVTASAAGQFRDCAGCPDMVIVPPGTFSMGSPPDDPDHQDAEGPQHRVTVARRFAIGKFDVTREQYALFAAGTGGAALDPKCDWTDPKSRGEPFRQGPREPVVCVSWNDANAYAAWLSARTGHVYRLPSEAEWEYACRAGTTSAFNVGPTITTDLANYCGTGGAVCGDSNGKSIASDVYDGVTYTSGAYAQGPTGTFRGTTTPAGTFPPNRFGLYDMHGNVWEYCLDRASDNYAGAPTDGSPNLSGPADGERVLRGGSWSHNPAICRSAYRDFLAPDNSGWQGRIGLRVVCAR
jgi:formylglycine-generating enzyme required for sulfatase activity